MLKLYIYILRYILVPVNKKRHRGRKLTVGKSGQSCHESSLRHG